ncbi:MAG: PP0621 family protein [Rhodocyclaceae bacterium]|nr:PP0621 family protein [Rhodocyclaceae bacterium]
MLKVILLILAILLVYWLFWGQRKKNAADGSADKKSAPANPEKMVICAHCQLHVPESECVIAEGRHYCSDEHARLGQS